MFCQLFTYIWSNLKKYFKLLCLVFRYFIYLRKIIRKKIKSIYSRFKFLWRIFFTYLWYLYFIKYSNITSITNVDYLLNIILFFFYLIVLIIKPYMMDVYLYESQPYKMLPKYEFLWWIGERRRCKENRKKRLKFMLWLKTVPIKQNGTHTFLKRTPHCSLFRFWPTLFEKMRFQRFTERTFKVRLFKNIGDGYWLKMVRTSNNKRSRIKKGLFYRR